MGAGISSARQVRAQHRHELRTLTYVTLEQANGGVVRNLSHSGIGVQMVAAVRPRQQLRIRFELRYPRVRVETRGEVVWSKFSGQCGIRFLDLSAGLRRQINEWIFGDLLERISFHADRAGSMFGGPALDQAIDDGAPGNGLAATVEEDDGLMVSAAPLKVIELPVRSAPVALDATPVASDETLEPWGGLDWLSQPLSPRGVAWTVDTLVVVAALLLFSLVFLSVTRDSPPWPFAMAGGAIFLVAAIYWGFFWIVGGESLGTRLARLEERRSEGREDGSRFR